MLDKIILKQVKNRAKIPVIQVKIRTTILAVKMTYK